MRRLWTPCTSELGKSFISLLPREGLVSLGKRGSIYSIRDERGGIS